MFSSDRGAGEGTGSDIWKMNWGGADLVNLTAAGSNDWEDVWPSWSPEGTQIAYFRYREDEGGSELRLMDADGGNSRRVMPLDSRPGGPPIWSPDGVRIAFVLGEEGQQDVLAVEWESGRYAWITGETGTYYGISWSPDSTAILFMQSLGEMERAIHLNIFVEDSIYHADTITPIEYPAWSPVAELAWP